MKIHWHIKTITCELTQSPSLSQNNVLTFLNRPFFANMEGSRTRNHDHFINHVIEHVIHHVINRVIEQVIDHEVDLEIAL